MTPAFLLTCLVIVAAPGTGVLYTLATGLTRGRAASVAAAFGCTLGIVPHMAAAILGVAALLHASAVAFQSFKIVGVGWLLFMAWRTWRDRTPPKLDAEPAPRATLRIVATAVLVNILNPKLSIFFLAFLPQFVSASDSAPVATMLGLGGVFMAMTFAVFVCYGIFAAAMRDHVLARPRVLTALRGAFATAFLALGAKLAFAER